MISQKTLRVWLYPALIFFICLSFLYPLFHSQFFITHDGENHIARIGAYYKSFLDGNILPRWAGDLNYGYGTPVFIFFYPLSGYLGSFFHALGFSLENVFKLISGIAFISCGLTFYIWTRNLLEEKYAFVAALFYALAPYHFLDMYVRGDIGELLGLVFVPLAFWAIDTKKYIVGSIFYALIIISHQGVALLFSPILLLYFLINIKTKRELFSIFQFFGIGLCLSAFFWLPALYEAKFTSRNLFLESMYSSHFLSIDKLISFVWGFGSDVNKPGGLCPKIGLLQFIIALGGIISIFLAKKDKKIIIFWLLIFFISIFMTTTYSDLFWKKISLLKQLEFPWRIIMVASFAAAVLAGFTSKYLLSNTFLRWIVIILLIITSMQIAYIRPMPSKTDTYYLSFSGTTFFHNVATTVWTRGDPSRFAKKQLEVIDGEMKITSSKKKSQVHTYTVDAKKQTRVIDNTIYFPGWRVTIDGRQVPIEFQDMNYSGFITFYIPPGHHTVTVEFRESPIRLVSDIISVIALLGIGVCFFLKKKGKIHVV